MSKLEVKDIDYLVVHCSATSAYADIGANTIRTWHKNKGWSDIGYHYVIRRNGKIELGRNVDTQGAHTLGINGESIGICMIGGVDSRGMPDDNFTDSQKESLVELLQVLQKIYIEARVIGHRELSNKACPSFNIHMFLKDNNIENIYLPVHYKVHRI